MTDDERISDRLLDQRLRNRIMEELLGLADGEEDVRRSGAGEYFNGFFDWFPDKVVPPNSAMNHAECEAASEVVRLMAQACQATRRNITVEQLLASGWVSQIAPVAKSALDVFMRRGRFSEEQEEAEPSDASGWPWQ